MYGFSRLFLSVTLIVTVLASAEASADNVLIDNNFGGNQLTTKVIDGSLVEDFRINSFSSLPFQLVQTSSIGQALSETTYDFFEAGATTTFDFTISHARGDHAQAIGHVIFVPLQDMTYELSGTYNMSGSRTVSQAIFFRELFSSDPRLFANSQKSETTPDESFTLGEQGGDSFGQLEGSLSGQLFAGRLYRLSWQWFISSLPPDGSVATAVGSFTLILQAVNVAPSCAVNLSSAELNFVQPTPGSFVVTEGETITVLFDGDDPDGDDLTVSGSGLPTGSSLSPSSGAAPLTATFEWTPTAAAKSGAPYTVSVAFTDPLGETATCEFSIQDINLRPLCDAGGGLNGTRTFECEGPDGALVTLIGSATDADDDDTTLMFHWDVSDVDVILDDDEIAMPTGVFPIGVTMATLTVADGRGGVDICDVKVVVQDTTPPEVMCTTDMNALWPPSHDMRGVTVIVTTSDVCENPDPLIFPLIVTVRSDESDNATGNGDGNTTGDVNGQDGFTVPVDLTPLFAFDASIGSDGAWVAMIELRAERDGNGDGRAYIIDVLAVDSFFNVTTTSCVVVVPHDRRGGGGAN